MDVIPKAIVLDRDPGDVSTIEDEASIEEAREAYRRLREEITAGMEERSR